ncbi:Nickel-dependent hydrogenase large subunit (plasmid) [Cupriavidus necator H16]|uniref:HupV protein n=2 Tax=Cupriavidus necator TaxID=106590 RepID=Q79IP6_CUPNH|nr:nickel-dependent hydrogenase large subunit [Cupriavidus necator]AAB49365.1 [NiFe] hydrogenase-like protein large subunit [Cupriavidus necator H16]AAP85777.1 regulatory [NiFe] hydrogenase large subunit [Cupriavidus necator H16]QCC05308.1 HupV protein [Cupriavidus necator H16]QQB81480.1 nickel-dependent hydrogenase large subunit [Cupriavidus necator]
MERLVVGPFNRVEGDLEVNLEVASGRVCSARVNATMYRGLEQILLHRHPLDALVYAPRVCGICSVSQSVAASRALADLAGVTVPANGMLAMNLMLATENLADHLTHFYLFFMPDFTREIYAGRPWHTDATARFSPTHGKHHRLAIAARQRWFTLMGTLGGKWPHTESVQPGGSSRAIDAAERVRLLGRVREFRCFLEQTLYAAPLEDVVALDSEVALWRWHAQAPQAGDLRCFLTIAQDAALDQMGPGPGTYLSYGAYPQPEGGFCFAQGVWRSAQGRLDALDLAAISEDATSAWLVDQGGARHPANGLTAPAPDKVGAYTWNKAPRLAGAVLETGAIARQLAGAQPLVRDAVARCGATVYTRVLARLVELARVVPLMEDWLQSLEIGAPYWASAHLPDQGAGVGLTEAARGSLGHWVSVRDGRIDNYQIVAPTSWNFSPRDIAGQPGAVEKALEGAPVLQGETTPVAVQHIVRSFDPCMVCTVH